MVSCSLHFVNKHHHSINELHLFIVTVRKSSEKSSTKSKLFLSNRKIDRSIDDFQLSMFPLEEDDRNNFIWKKLLRLFIVFSYLLLSISLLAIALITFYEFSPSTDNSPKKTNQSNLTANLPFLVFLTSKSACFNHNAQGKKKWIEPNNWLWYRTKFSFYVEDLQVINRSII